MNKLLKLSVFLVLGLFMTQACQAEDQKILVLPDTIQFDRTNYYIFPDSATMFATDTINEFKKDGRVQTVSMAEVRDTLRKNVAVYVLTKKALKEFKYNYNISFVDLKSIAHQFSTSKVLVITSQTDYQNYLLKRTLWDVLNIPGMKTVSPTYKLSTYVAFVDVDKEQIIWQNTYYKTISSFEDRMVAQNFAPATEQLEKIKFYSAYLLSPHIATTVEAKMFPPILPSPKDNNNDSGIVNVSNVQPPEIPDQDNLQIRSKVLIPDREQSKINGEMVNDL